MKLLSVSTSSAAAVTTGAAMRVVAANSAKLPPSVSPNVFGRWNGPLAQHSFASLSLPQSRMAPPAAAVEYSRELSASPFVAVYLETKAYGQGPSACAWL